MGGQCFWGVSVSLLVCGWWVCLPFCLVDGLFVVVVGPMSGEGLLVGLLRLVGAGYVGIGDICYPGIRGARRIASRGSNPGLEVFLGLGGSISHRLGKWCLLAL